MANYVRNRVVIAHADDEQVKKVLDFIKSDESLVDFNKIVPMPSELDTEDSTLGELGRDYILSFYMDDCPEADERRAKYENLKEEEKKKSLQLGFEYISNKVKYGHENWYEWRCANWGTKWDASDVEVKDNILSFETPWSDVVPLIAALSSKFPEVSFEYEFAEEEIGFNVGKGTIKNGNTEGMTYPEEESEEALRIAYDLWPEYENDGSDSLYSDPYQASEGFTCDRIDSDPCPGCQYDPSDDSLPF